MWSTVSFCSSVSTNSYTYIRTKEYLQSFSLIANDEYVCKFIWIEVTEGCHNALFDIAKYNFCNIACAGKGAERYNQQPKGKHLAFFYNKLYVLLCFIFIA